MNDVALSFSSVFLAEFGDKTQLLVLAFVARMSAFRLSAVLLAAVLVLQTLSVTLGSVLAQVIPADAIQGAAGLLYVGFGVWALRASHEGDEAGAPPPSILALGLAFFVAELGDKTMLMTATLAADRTPVAVWIGSVLAMSSSIVLAVTLGQRVFERIPTRVVQRASAVLFLALGAAAIGGVVV